ncbi:STAS domain-containing protein [Candidatus Obscuribacterales bacterium]|nr:STAS domain-containing protein [Candidatus Obscuribacterales bacterium]MBX3152448.1 STAS domain-containing protein [Candidatus Obscuribacterales bacterium]
MSAKSTDKGTNYETVRIMGSLDRSIEEADRLLAADKTDVLLDFSACTFITVDGLEWLEELLLRAESKKHSVIFESIPPTVYKVFKVSHIAPILRACGGPTLPNGPVC